MKDSFEVGEKSSRKDLLKAVKLLFEQVSYLKGAAVHLFNRGYAQGYKHALGGVAHFGADDPTEISPAMITLYNEEAVLMLEAQARAEDVVAEEACGSAGSDRSRHPLNSQRILVADIDVALGRAHGVGSYEQTLDHSEGIALHDGAVHERAWVAFVAVTHDGPRFARGVAAGSPLFARGESCTASAA